MYIDRENEMAKDLDLQGTRLSLERLRIELTERMKDPSNRVQLRSENSSDPSMMAQRYILRQANSNALARAEQLLDQVENALARLDAGSYGICSGCGGKIPPGRLKALPYAEFCVECKEINESNSITP
jgi:RNA polymerase-binding transcription factor